MNPDAQRFFEGVLAAAVAGLAMYAVLWWLVTGG